MHCRIDDLLKVTNNKRDLLNLTLKVFSGIFIGALSLEACLGVYQIYLMKHFAKIASMGSIMFWLTLDCNCPAKFEKAAEVCLRPCPTSMMDRTVNV